MFGSDGGQEGDGFTVQAAHVQMNAFQALCYGSGTYGTPSIVLRRRGLGNVIRRSWSWSMNLVAVPESISIGKTEVLSE